MREGTPARLEQIGQPWGGTDVRTVQDGSRRIVDDQRMNRVDYLHDELQRLRDAGCDDVLLFPCPVDVDQPRRLAAVLDAPARDG
jgi:hypothetical protein